VKHANRTLSKEIAAMNRAFNMMLISLQLNSVIKCELSSNLAPLRTMYFFPYSAILLLYVCQDYSLR